MTDGGVRDESGNATDRLFFFNSSLHRSRPSARPPSPNDDDRMHVFFVFPHIYKNMPFTPPFTIGCTPSRFPRRPPPPPYCPQPPEVFLEEQLERSGYVLLSPGDASLPPALRDLPADWRGLLAAYGAGGDCAVGSEPASEKGAGRYVLSVRFDPFQADLFAGDELAVSANRR